MQLTWSVCGQIEARHAAKAAAGDDDAMMAHLHEMGMAGGFEEEEDLGDGDEDGDADVRRLLVVGTHARTRTSTDSQVVSHSL